MRALTLHQPWATLVALGVKTIETRGWRTSYRGTLAVHAGTHRPPMMHLPPTPPGRGELPPQWFVIDTITAPEHQRPHRTDIRDRVPRWATTPTLFYPRRGPHGRPYTEGTPATEQGAAVYLPLGAVVATCTLVDVAPIGDSFSFRTGVVEGDEGDYPARPVVVRHRSGLLAPEDELVLDYAQGVVRSIADQLPYGDYTPGRWAWLLADVQPLDPPVPARGSRMLWEWQPELVAQ